MRASKPGNIDEDVCLGLKGSTLKGEMWYIMLGAYKMDFLHKSLNLIVTTRVLSLDFFPMTCSSKNIEVYFEITKGFRF